MTKILSIIFYLKQEEFIGLLNFSKLKNIFLIFRNINFDFIHEVILHLIKIITLKRINENINNNNFNINNDTEDNNNLIGRKSYTNKNIIQNNLNSSTANTSTNSNNNINNSFRNSLSLNNYSNNKNSKIFGSKDFAINNNNNSNNSLSNNNSSNNSGNDSNSNSFKRNSCSSCVGARTTQSKSLSKINNNNNTRKLLKLNSINNNNNSFEENSDSNNNNSNYNITKKSTNSNKNNNNNTDDLDYLNIFPLDKKISESNANLINIEELNDILTIFFPTLCMMKAKIINTEVNKNSKLYYKFNNCLEIISFIIITATSNKENSNKLKLLIYFKVIENMVTMVNINTNRGIYRDIHLYFLNKNYLMVNNKIKILKFFFYLHSIINSITEKGINNKVKF